MPIHPEDLSKSIDISNLPIFEVERLTTRRKPYVVSCKELIDMIYLLNNQEELIKKAKSSLVTKLNEFLDYEE